MKILIVDDSPTIRAALRGLVDKMGHSVIEADDGSKALKIYQGNRPDLVLIDGRVGEYSPVHGSSCVELPGC